MATAKQPMKRKRAGRPGQIGGSSSSFDQAIFDRICGSIAGGKSLREICKAAEMPARETFLRWVAKDEALALRYAEAQNLRAEHYFDEIIDIADKGVDPQKTRVQIDARKWVLARMNPKKYGEKLTQEVTGEGGGGAADSDRAFRRRPGRRSNSLTDGHLARTSAPRGTTWSAATRTPN